ncbi:MAG: Ktr system potassium transporter B, partial [Actinomycetota bacterium]|nr:Ktr system potassium transporter B [Actinomycetota bacterium]
TQEGISWVDALFVSVSAVSVTGLSSVEYSATFTTFGSTVVMVLMQVGGLGIMVFTTLGALLFGQKVGFRNLLTVREELGSADSPRNVFKLLGQIAAVTLLVEALGATFLLISFLRHGLSYSQGLFQAVFHAIAAFCNSGFTALPDGNLASYADDPIVNLVFVTLIILGGLGFPVLVNLYYYRQMRRLTLHSKLVLITTAALILIGVLSVALLEWTNPATLGGESVATRLWMSLFQGVTPRTAGFSTVEYSQMRESTLFLQIGLMFIGAAPASTGGGVRVTTLALLVLVVLSLARGQEEVSAFGRRIPRRLIQKALAVLSGSALLVIIATLAIMVSDGLTLLPAIFEITSAFGTVGLSMNVSQELSTFAKLVLMGVMFLGRVGTVTLILALSARQKPKSYTYPQEDIAIG